MNIFTDGSMLPKPRRGGMGILLVVPDTILPEEKIVPVFLEGYTAATNNQMELKAVILGLKEARKMPELEMVRKVVVWTDSKYVTDNYFKARSEWPKAQWYTKSGTPVLNADLWKDLFREIGKFRNRVHICWIKGKKNPYTKKVDKLAKQSAATGTKILNIKDVRKKNTSIPLSANDLFETKEPIIIRIVTQERLKVQRLWRLRVETIDSDEMTVGDLFVLEPLSTRFYYRVTLIQKKGYLTIGEIFEKMPRKAKLPTPISDEGKNLN